MHLLMLCAWLYVIKQTDTIGFKFIRPLLFIGIYLSLKAPWVILMMDI